MKPSHGGQLYRHFDAEGRLLYVGISKNATERLRGHKHKSSWFKEIARVEIQHFPTREEARAAEALAIKSEKPLLNKAISFKVAPVITDDSQIIDALGGTGALAALLKLDKSTVSCWRKRGIPKPWRLYLSKIRPSKLNGSARA